MFINNIQNPTLNFQILQYKYIKEFFFLVNYFTENLERKRKQKNENREGKRNGVVVK